MKDVRMSFVELTKVYGIEEHCPYLHKVDLLGFSNYASIVITFELIQDTLNDSQPLLFMFFSCYFSPIYLFNCLFINLLSYMYAIDM